VGLAKGVGLEMLVKQLFVTGEEFETIDAE
jgi:hypothetical protein